MHFLRRSLLFFLYVICHGDASHTLTADGREQRAEGRSPAHPADPSHIQQLPIVVLFRFSDSSSNSQLKLPPHMAGDIWQMADGKEHMAEGKQHMANGRRHMVDDKRQMADVGWLREEGRGQRADPRRIRQIRQLPIAVLFN